MNHRLLFLVVLFSISAHGQNWSTFLDSSRAVDWSGAGFTIPNYTVNCATQPTLLTGSGNASANSTAIQNALASCDATHNVVNLQAGTFYVAGVTFGSQGKQVLRGAGAGSTDLIMTASTGCSGVPAGVCMIPNMWVYAGNATVQPPSGNRQCMWTAGYAKGTTSITLNSCPGGAPPVGQMLVLDQSNDLTDNGGVFLCDSYTSSQSGGSSCTGNDGSPTNGDGRRIGGYTYSQKQIVNVQSTSGSGTGPFTVTISPGVFFPNIRSSQSPGAWWPGTIVNEGLENVTIDGTALSSNNIEMVACYQCWVKGARSIDAARAHIMLDLSANDVIRDSYFYQSQAHLEESYGIEPEATSGLVIENNIFQQLTDPIMTGNTSGSVVDYNYSADIIFTGGSGQFLMPSYNSHNAGNEMNLWEGNNFQLISTDDEWGSSYAGTFFRNMNSGWQNGKTAATNALIDRAFARANNVIGNIQGQAGYHNTYESYATSSSGGVNGSAVNTSIYNLGWTGADGDGQCTAPPICDAAVRSTLMRWGNYDVVHAATQWNSTEAAPGAVAFINANFTASYFNSLSHTLPASLYYSSTPSWWPSGKNWPAIGPDISSGNVGTCTGTYVGSQATNSSQCTGGTLNTAWASHVTSIPAQDCYLNVMGGPPDGTGTILSFDANTCYNGGGTHPNPPTGLAAIVN
jgi:hypothetical protein